MDRVTSNSARDLLERSAPAIAAGAANVISVQAIRERSGDRWPRKRQQVEDFISRAFARAATPHDVIAALNDAEFLTVQPEASKAAALALSANVLKETLTFFLGAAAHADMRLFTVTGFAGEALSVEPVDSAALPAAPPPSSAPGRAGPAAPSAAIETKALRRRVRLVPAQGPPCRLTLAIEPAWNVAARVVTSFVVRSDLQADADDPSGLATSGELSSSLAAEAALAALDYAGELLASGPKGLQVGLHLPLALPALAHSPSRYRLLYALKALDPAIRRRLILEVTHLPAGFPQGRMSELAAVLSPYGRAVLARAPSETVDLAPWRRCGLSGVALDCSHLDPADRQAHLRLGRFASAAAEVGPACVGYALRSRSLLVSAWAAGFTHLGGAAVEAEVRTPAAQRLEPAHLYPGAPRGRRRSVA